MHPKAMFNPSSSSARSHRDLSMHHAVSFSSALPTAPAKIPRGGGFFHDNGGLFSPPSFAASAPPPYSYPSPLPPYYIHRNNASSHSFPLHLRSPATLGGNAAFSCPSPPACQFAAPPVSSSPSSSPGDFYELSSGNIRRVFSAGDLQMQGMNVSQAPPPPQLLFSGENCGHEVGDPFSQKVGKYSADERKERIERYRTKRQQRNFHKKITYACRKTLADSRPRVQGRFARNLEAEADVVAGLEREASDNSYEYCPSSEFTTTNGSNCSDSQRLCRETGGGATIFDADKWWWGTAASNGQHQHQQKLGLDVDVDEDQLWASLSDMLENMA